MFSLSYWLDQEKKYDNLIRKNANIGGEEKDKWGKGEIFTVLGGKM